MVLITGYFAEIVKAKMEQKGRTAVS